MAPKYPADDGLQAVEMMRGIDRNGLGIPARICQ